jgi:hypothetical protein
MWGSILSVQFTVTSDDVVLGAHLEKDDGTCVWLDVHDSNNVHDACAEPGMKTYRFTAAGAGAGSGDTERDDANVTADLPLSVLPLHYSQWHPPIFVLDFAPAPSSSSVKVSTKWGVLESEIRTLGKFMAPRVNDTTFYANSMFCMVRCATKLLIHVPFGVGSSTLKSIRVFCRYFEEKGSDKELDCLLVPCQKVETYDEEGDAYVAEVDPSQVREATKDIDHCFQLEFEGDVEFGSCKPCVLCSYELDGWMNE